MLLMWSIFVLAFGAHPSLHRSRQETCTYLLLPRQEQGERRRSVTVLDFGLTGSGFFSNKQIRHFFMNETRSPKILWYKNTYSLNLLASIVTPVWIPVAVGSPTIVSPSMVRVPGAPLPVRVWARSTTKHMAYSIRNSTHTMSYSSDNSFGCFFHSANDTSEDSITVSMYMSVMVVWVMPYCPPFQGRISGLDFTSFLLDKTSLQRLCKCKYKKQLNS